MAERKEYKFSKLTLVLPESDMIKFTSELKRRGGFISSEMKGAPYFLKAKISYLEWFCLLTDLILKKEEDNLPVLTKDEIDNEVTEYVKTLLNSKKYRRQFYKYLDDHNIKLEEYRYKYRLDKVVKGINKIFHEAVSMKENIIESPRSKLLIFRALTLRNKDNKENKVVLYSPTPENNKAFEKLSSLYDIDKKVMTIIKRERPQEVKLEKASKPLTLPREKTTPERKPPVPLREERSKTPMEIRKNNDELKYTKKDDLTSGWGDWEYFSLFSWAALAICILGPLYNYERGDWWGGDMAWSTTTNALIIQSIGFIIIVISLWACTTSKFFIAGLGTSVFSISMIVYALTIHNGFLYTIPPFVPWLLFIIFGKNTE